MNQNTAKLLRRSIKAQGDDPKSPKGRAKLKQLKRQHTAAPAPVKAKAKNAMRRIIGV